MYKLDKQEVWILTNEVKCDEEKSIYRKDENGTESLQIVKNE